MSVLGSVNHQTWVFSGNPTPWESAGGDGQVAIKRPLALAWHHWGESASPEPLSRPGFCRGDLPRRFLGRLGV